MGVVVVWEWWWCGSGDGVGVVVVWEWWWCGRGGIGGDGELRNVG